MDGIQVEYSFPASPDVLWRALTERAKIAGWWGENDFVPETGHNFTVSAIGLAALAGPIQCTVLELEPQRRLVMSWRVGTTRAVVSLLVEASQSGSVLVVTRRGSVGPTTPADVEQAMTSLFDERLRAVVTRAPAVIGAGPSGSLSLWGNGPAALIDSGGPGPAHGLDNPPRRRPSHPLRGPRQRRPQIPRRPGRPKPLPVWPSVAIAVVVGIAAMVYLLGALGGGSGSSTTLGPNDRGGPQPAESGPAPVGDLAGGNPVGPPTSGQTNPGGQSAQPGQPGQPVPTIASTSPTTPPTATVPPPASAHLAASFQRAGLPGIAFRVTVSVTNTGGATGNWNSVAVDLTGTKLKITVLGSTVTHRNGTSCFAPVGSFATVAPGASATFSFDVGILSGGLLGTVTGVALDSPACA